MSQRRCFLPDLEQPGSLQLLTLALGSHCASFILSCLEGALEKWQELFTIRILGYIFCPSGVVMLAYIPNKPLSEHDARLRTEAFDDRYLGELEGRWKTREHRYDAEKLNSLSDFMHDFTRDFLFRHRKLERPEHLPEGTYPYPRLTGPYKAKTVQHDALPPLFTLEQVYHIRLALFALGFTKRANVCALHELYVSPHGLGKKSFLEKLEVLCVRYLHEGREMPEPELRYPDKWIVPYCPEVWRRRVQELAAQEAHERHPQMCDFIQSIGMMKDAFLTVECFRKVPWTSQKVLELELIACLPFTLSLILTDGLLRWYYKVHKDTVFPEYNYYRQKYPWECKQEPLESADVR